MARIYALANQKGGVGKTTTAINLAACLAEAGERALVIDLDPQANATSGLGMRANGTSSYDLLDGAPLSELTQHTAFANLDIVPSKPALAGAVVELAQRTDGERYLSQALASGTGSYDFVFLDCPPSLGPLTVNALAAADRVLVPVQAEYYALEGLSQLMQSIDLIRRRLNPSLGIGGVGFAVPFAAAWAFAWLVLRWHWQASEICGIALSTTSVAVVYAVLVETGLNQTDLGKLILTACFVCDIGTVGALGILFANYNALLAAFALRTYLRRASSEPPKWLGALQEAGPKRAFTLGVTLILVMPSDFVVMLTTGVHLVGNGLSFVSALPLIALTTLIAALPLLGFVLFHKHAERVMPKVRDWMNSHSWLINIFVAVLFIILILG